MVARMFVDYLLMCAQGGTRGLAICVMSRCSAPCPIKDPKRFVRFLLKDAHRRLWDRIWQRRTVLSKGSRARCGVNLIHRMAIDDEHSVGGIAKSSSARRGTGGLRSAGQERQCRGGWVEPDQ